MNIKRDRQGNFLKCKARWVLRGFQDKQKWDQQTDSPAASRPGFRMACQLASNHSWTLTHMDIKTAFLQGDRYDDTRNVLNYCSSQRSRSSPYIAARIKKPAYGLNDAPRRWFNIIDHSLRSYGCVPTRGDRSTYVLYSNSCRASENEKVSTETVSKVADNDMLDRILDPHRGNNSKGFAPCGVICLHVDDLFMAGKKEFDNRVLERLRADYNIGSEDTNGIAFVGQRIRWVKGNGATASHIQVDQQLAVDDLHEIVFERSLRYTVYPLFTHRVPLCIRHDKLVAIPYALPIVLQVFTKRF